MFTKICHIYLRQKSPSLAGSAWQPIQNPSQARLRLKSRLDFRAKLGSGSEESGISELGSFGLGRIPGFELAQARARKIISWLNTPSGGGGGFFFLANVL